MGVRRWRDLPSFSPKKQQLLPIFLLKEVCWWRWVKAKKPKQTSSVRITLPVPGVGGWCPGSCGVVEIQWLGPQSENQRLSAHCALDSRALGMPLDLSLRFLFYKTGLTVPSPQVQGRGNAKPPA